MPPRMLLLLLTSAAAATRAVQEGRLDQQQQQQHTRAVQDGRLKALVQQMTLDEKLGLLHGTPSNYTGATAAVPRLKIPRLLLNDGPQGFRTPPALDRTTTAFPSGLAVAATFDDALAATWAAAVASEFAKKGATVLLGPGLNVARVPRNGRNFEYVSGEDPYLGARMAASIIPAIQAQGVVATAKHYVLNNQETGRIGSNSVIDARTWHEIYLPPFEAAVAHGALAAMCSYNRITLNNVTAWACEHPLTLAYLKGLAPLFVMSDWSATHSTGAVSFLDQEMPADVYFGSALRDAVHTGAIAGAAVDAAVLNVLRAMQRIGALDRAPRGDLQADVSTEAHRAVARRVAAGATVLLKNDGVVPLRTCAGLIIVGNLTQYTVGGGSGYVAGRTVSLFDAFAARCGHAVPVYEDLETETAKRAVATAATVLVVAGASSSEGFDRATLALDDEGTIRQAAALHRHVAVACAAPGAFLTPWRDAVDAVLVLWPGGQELANALVDVVFGAINPTARLPLTLPASDNDLKFTRAMYPGLVDPDPPPGCADPCLRVHYEERLEVGYRRYDAHRIDPAFAFGHGLSYTRFVYANLTVSRSLCSFDVRNVGEVAGAEVAQLYVAPPARSGAPPQQLKGFRKTGVLAPGAAERVEFRFDERTFAAWGPGGWRAVTGTHGLRVGASSRDVRLVGTVDV